MRRGDFGEARVVERDLVRWDLVIPTATVVLEIVDIGGMDFVPDGRLDRNAYSQRAGSPVLGRTGRRGNRPDHAVRLTSLVVRAPNSQYDLKASGNPGRDVGRQLISGPSAEAR